MFKESGGGQVGPKVLTPVPFPTRRQSHWVGSHEARGKRLKQADVEFGQSATLLCNLFVPKCLWTFLSLQLNG